ncbi:MAG: DCC1-like thiol-disulfide oxidoreductase family protein [Bacteroidota bacterium]|nr:DCC1-like thiol-disulfide oxidoreductase family protein [Bacteroidota bacterium]
MSAPAGNVVLFDGDCVLCSNAVLWIISRDKRRLFRYASLTSEFARTHLAAELVRHTPTIVLIEEKGRISTRSTAVLRILHRLGLPWNLLATLLHLVPKVLRDAFYDWIARNRYRWFGYPQRCLIPTADLNHLFYD